MSALVYLHLKIFTKQPPLRLLVQKCANLEKCPNVMMHLNIYFIYFFRQNHHYSFFTELCNLMNISGFLCSPDLDACNQHIKSGPMFPGSHALQCNGLLTHLLIHLMLRRYIMEDCNEIIWKVDVDIQCSWLRYPYERSYDN